ncbi:hypothetical protein COY25_00585 [Candidatus Uhrbacteria bacterium CG_4_10_14_0_2_um_filter_41_7]|uniref:Uncharacterized protein n=1 Tax=Candidatus Uhrbacteria bacterium CG_4_9_14_3_um_filter_41_35 TaxID=1975034 RepID=A0A2M7XFM7_9BACT|nr:MAG: hypothetical protein COY25_00585 [Candidatus Uhrbacteria bacterium CG_4_10_14_0_2_um_filter_41_7]PJA46536.1 MAG: hypothetical protein CO173_02100 [Candidatus Uhrbacteria bacterium CG_4_9_14_3_um_filter_41_35]
MKLDNKKLAKILVESLENASESELPSITKEFVSFLGQNQLLSSWREIEANVHKVWKEKYGASNVSIMLAHNLSKEAKEALSKVAQGADVTIKVDDRLIGGAIIRIDDMRIDGSVTGALKRLKQTLLA